MSTPFVPGTIAGDVLVERDPFRYPHDYRGIDLTSGQRVLVRRPNPNDRYLLKLFQTTVAQTALLAGTAAPQILAALGYRSLGDLVGRADLLAGVEAGFYVTEMMGMGVNGVTGDYSRGAAGFWIENGELADPVSEVTLAGNLKEMFANLTPADDLEFLYGTNAPTLRIDGMTLAGG